MKRAVHESQKIERRAAILASAEKILAKKPVEDLTLAEVARKLGLVKGTLYRYFSTRETLILEVLEKKLFEWLGELIDVIPQLSGTPELAACISRSLAKHSLLIKLFSVVHIKLEKNLTLPRLVDFKRKTAMALEKGSVAIEAQFPELKGSGSAFLLIVYELAIGIGHMTDRSPEVNRAIEISKQDVFKIDFETELCRNLKIVLKGMQNMPRRIG